jgi:probable F420-dependent oxidoreductase
MKIGVTFPQWAIKSDPIAIRDFAQEAEGLGYDYILLYDAVVTTKNAEHPENWHEPFTTMAYMAGATTNIEFAAGVVVLPSRQTVLVAKQAIELDILTGGRFRLGVSVGWNEKEYQAMGADKSSRAKRIDEQMMILRQLWEDPFVSFNGDYHTIDNIGIHPRPVQQTCPLWVGGRVDATIRRVAKLGDGWMMHNEYPTLEWATQEIATLHQYIKEVGRKPEDVELNIIGIEVGEDKDWQQVVNDWENIGMSYFDVATWKSGFETWEEHMNAIRRFKNRVDGK